jgi:hypothetical protein
VISFNIGELIQYLLLDARYLVFEKHRFQHEESGGTPAAELTPEEPEKDIRRRRSDESKMIHRRQSSPWNHLIRGSDEIQLMIFNALKRSLHHDDESPLSERRTFTFH